MTASRARQLADVISGNFDIPTESLDNIPKTVISDIHAFTFDLDGNVYWTHGEELTALQDSDQNDIYDLVIVGSDDQTYSVNQTTGQFEVTIS
jgi:hypothetical protein